MALNKDERELLIFVANFGEGVGNALADGKVEWMDAIHFGDALTTLLPAVKGLENVKASNFKDPVNRAEAVSIIREEFDLEDDKLELKVEKTIVVVDALIDLFYTWKE